MNEEEINKILFKLGKIKTDIDKLQEKKSIIVEEIKKDIKGWYKKVIVMLFGGFSLLTIYALFQIYSNVIYKSEEFITKSITQKFSEPQISVTLTEVAEGQAQKIIVDKLEPAIKTAITSVNQKNEAFGEDLEKFKKTYDLELKKLSQEIEYLKDRNDVLRLSDKAIATGDATPFKKLENIYETTSDENIKMVALSGILRVKNYFGTMTRMKGVKVTYTHPKTGKEFTEKDIPTEALIQGLKSAEHWQYRARIADILKERKEKHVPEALLEAINEDVSIEVRKKALDSFESITGFKSRDLLKYEPAKKWWENNKKDVEKKLDNLQTTEDAIRSISKE